MHHVSGHSNVVFVAHAAIGYQPGFTMYVWWALAIAFATLIGARSSPYAGPSPPPCTGPDRSRAGAHVASTMCMALCAEDFPAETDAMLDHAEEPDRALA